MVSQPLSVSITVCGIRYTVCSPSSVTPGFWITSAVASGVASTVASAVASGVISAAASMVASAVISAVASGVAA
ncbi:MAG: hypothetical protein U0521_14240 [Anaerolineae bacterium]